jgi:hypothetical protein
MRDYLLDLVEHTYDLGCIDLVKIVGDTSKSEIVGLAEDLSVVIRGNFHNPVADFVGTFGMPNLGKLKTLLNLQEYGKMPNLLLPNVLTVNQMASTLKTKLATLKTTIVSWLRAL